MPTGLKNSPDVMGIPSATGVANFVPHSATNRKYQIKFTADDSPLPGPPVGVAPGQSVTVRALSANAQVVKVGDYPEALGGPNVEVVTPDTEISCPVDNLNQIWAMGKTGDGIVIAIRAGRT